MLTDCGQGGRCCHLATILKLLLALMQGELQAMGDIGKGTLASQAIEGPQSQLFLSKRPTPEGTQ